MIHPPLVRANTSLAVSHPGSGLDSDRAPLPLALKVEKGNSTQRDYFGYMVPTMLVGPMLGYGTRLEPLIALGIGGFWAFTRSSTLSVRAGAGTSR